MKMVFENEMTRARCSPVYFVVDFVEGVASPGVVVEYLGWLLPLDRPRKLNVATFDKPVADQKL